MVCIVLHLLTIRLVIGHFLFRVLWNQVPICICFRDRGHQTYCGHELDLLRLRDAIDHVAINPR